MKHFPQDVAFTPVSPKLTVYRQLVTDRKSVV